MSCRRNDEDLFVTSCFGKLNLKTGKLTLVNAGHFPPLIESNGSFDYFDIYPNFVLGGLDGIEYKQQELNLNPGDAILLYTSGIVEANEDYKEFYGRKRLKETLNKYNDESLDTILYEVEKDVDNFCNSNNQFSDRSMLIIRYNGSEDNE